MKRINKKIVVFIVTFMYVFTYLGFSSEIMVENAYAASSDFVISNGVLEEYKGNDSKVIIPKGVKKIGYNAFYSNINITTVEIPDSVTEIESWAFYGCTGIKEFTIPANVSKIGYSILNKCSNLRKLTVLSKKVKLYKFDEVNEKENYLTTIIGDTWAPDGIGDLKTPTKTLTVYGYKNSTAEGFVTCCSKMESLKKVFGIKTLKFVSLDKKNKATEFDKIEVPKSITLKKGKTKRISIIFPSELKKVDKFTKKKGQAKVSVIYSEEIFNDWDCYWYNIKKISNGKVKINKKGKGYLYTTVKLPNGKEKLYVTKVTVK